MTIKAKLTPEQVDAEFAQAKAPQGRYVDMLLPTGVRLGDADTEDLARAICIFREWTQEKRAVFLEAIAGKMIDDG